MAAMGNIEADAAAWVGSHLPHLRHPGSEVNLLTDDERQQEDTQEQPQEARMPTSKLADARDAISAMADNPLISAIAEAGIGKWMNPVEISNLVGLWREVENGRRARAAAPPKIDLTQATTGASAAMGGAQTSAQQLQPQRTA